ncbi:uncharacterized protein B0J16DRAFT_399825 [Fusarium flagelliforme]|uniref:uncharacterized protein n=1 Tax=Fusarium flagelliforme TaxID=2675880 RepID=UPI001E8E9206|nr:uncharacterized protein B0J16DRAFT_399825 [Fusarium flagelliforme]KAH7185978.1 hypothetical protein B0J16DRAFT_399825 [Fusarium flagelliforme]
MPSRSRSQNTRREDLPYPFPYNTGLYASVGSLVRTADGNLHHRDIAVHLQWFPLQENGIPPNYHVNHRWDENVDRVLGPIYEHRWTDLDLMIGYCQSSVRTKPAGFYVKNGHWTELDVELVGRLRAWGCPNAVVEVLVGWPNVSPSDEQLERGNVFLEDELDKIRWACRNCRH